MLPRSFQVSQRKNNYTMRQLLYLVSGYLMICLPLMGEHRRNMPFSEPASTPLVGIQTDDSFSVEELVQDVFVTGMQYDHQHPVP